jgi:uncharacterized protein with GYD domain
MPWFLWRNQYLPDTWAKLIENPEDRTAAVREMLESVGAQLHGCWWAVGGHEGYMVFEAPDNETASAALVRAIASGLTGPTDTVPLLTAAEMVKTLEHAQQVPLRDIGDPPTS